MHGQGARRQQYASAPPWEWPTPDAAPLQIDRGAAGLWQTLLKLHTRASLLMVTAHPDDEDGGMLAYESRGQGARAILFTLNRGEGGQNVMSDDFWDALGLVRTEELLAADRYYDVAAILGHGRRFRILENAGRSAGALGTRPASSKRPCASSA